MPSLDELLKLALQEDLGDGDHTTLATIPEKTRGKAMLIIKEAGMIAGIDIARKIFNILEPEMTFDQKLEDGSLVNPRDIA